MDAWMNTKQEEPLVSVVTPVYNGEKYLADCIESVLAQSYRNWEYIIVNNHSIDRTLEIAENYAKKDTRIQIYNNSELLPIMKNWNFALSKISAQSKYCKVVHADDWLFPQCVDQMVAVAETNPSVGLVGAYCLKGDRVVSDGLPYPSQFIPGRKISRWTLMGRVYLFTRPSSLLLRSDLIRKRPSFYNEAKLNADVEILYEILRNYDFGFVHQVLTFIRTHENSVSSTSSAPDNLFLLSNLDLFTKFGPVFLNPDEYRRRSKQKWKEYYRFLVHGLFQLRGNDFWKYHKDGLQRIGYRMSVLRLLFASLIEILGNSEKSVKIILTTIAEK